MSSDAALLQEIQRLKGAIDRHKNGTTRPHTSKNYHPYASSSSVNKKYINPAVSGNYTNPQNVAQADLFVPSSSHQVLNENPREVVIDGVMFESNQRRLTRKDLKTSTMKSSVRVSSNVLPSRGRGKGPSYTAPKRLHKSKFSKRKTPGGRNNMVLDNVKGTRSGKLPKAKKQCRFFTMTGECQRGRTCPYQHDPEKIAICPLFLSKTCPNNDANCRLSHDPTPSRVPLCHHFSNYGRCTRENCPYPHIRVGPRSGVCRDFAVVGYCDKGINCDKQHVRECPDFAEKGFCPNKSCKLPHVIRANMRRKPVTSASSSSTAKTIVNVVTAFDSVDELGKEGRVELPSKSFSGGTGAAEEFISLTFEESEDESEEEEEEEEEDSNEDNGSETFEDQDLDVDVDIS